MAISVVCGGCRSQYSVPESAAGKRAKCQKCGQVMQVPLDEPELVPIDDVPVLEPVEDEPQLAPLVSPVADLSSVLSDIPSLPSKLNTTYVAPTTPGVLTGTTVFLSILSGIITFLVSVVAGVLLLCTLSPYLSLTMLVLGLAATAGSVVLGMKQRLGLAWTVCGIYCCLSCLAIAKTGYDIASGVTSAAAEAVEREEARSTAENNSASSEPSTPTMPTEKPSEPAAEKSEPVKTALVTNNDLSSDSPPWKAAVYRPKLTDWSLIADPLPAWATIDDGKPLSITFEGSPISPVYFPATPGRMIGVNARVDGQPVLQVWDLHLRKQVGQLPGQNTFVQGEYIISPDGQNIAGMVHNSGGPQPNVNGQAASGSGLQLEVWSLADAQRIHQISLPFNQQAFHCEYLTNSRIVVCYHETTRFYFVVYDITTGREVCAGSADDDEGNIHKVVLSPGRRYLWNPQRDSITVWDLTNGKIVGTATPPKSCDLTGLALSPDGKELLLGMERRGTSYVVVMDLLTKAVKQHLALKFSGRPNPFRGNFGRPISCQWTADGQQWLAGQQLIQQATGELVDSLPVSTGDTSKAGMLLDHDQLLSLSNELGVWVVELKPLKAQLLAMKDRTPGTRAGVSPGLNPTTMPGRVRPRPGGDPTPGDLYATLLASDPDTWKQQWQWCETLNRPIVGLRWGIGVQMPISPAQAQAVLQPRPANHAALHWLKSEAGPVGAELVELLQAKTKDGKFGEFAGLKESSLTDVMILGGGDRTQVMTSARRAGVDLALVICLQSVTRGKTKDMSMTIQVQDLASAKKVWESSSLLSSKVAETTARGGEPFASILAEVTKFIDEQLLLAPLSKMPRPTIIARADAAQLHRTNPMASLAELRLYDHHRAIGKASMLEASTKLLGDAGDAAKLAGDDAAARDAIVQKYHAQWQSK